MRSGTIPGCLILAPDARNHGKLYKMVSNYSHLPLIAMVFQGQFFGNDELLMAQEHHKQCKVAYECT
jgi:hypothetical protein